MQQDKMDYYAEGSERFCTIHSLTIAAKAFDKRGSSPAVTLHISSLCIPCLSMSILLVFLCCALVSGNVHSEVTTAVYRMMTSLSESPTENSKVPHGAARNGATLNSVTLSVPWEHRLQTTGTSSHTVQLGSNSALCRRTRRVGSVCKYEYVRRFTWLKYVT